MQPLSAAVLAGGHSRRLGTDKALVTLASVDPPLARRVIERVGAVAADVFLVSAPRPAYAVFGVPLLPDLFGDTGALGGIASALAHARSDRCLVVSCDAPFLNRDLLAWMASQPSDYDVLIPRLPGESRQGGRSVFQTLHAIYARRCLPAIERSLAAGNRQIIGFFPDVDVRPVEEDQIRAIDPELRSFFSVNTPEALAVARSWRAEERQGDS